MVVMMRKLEIRSIKLILILPSTIKYSKILSHDIMHNNKNIQSMIMIASCCRAEKIADILYYPPWPVEAMAMDAVSIIIHIHSRLQQDQDNGNHL